MVRRLRTTDCGENSASVGFYVFGYGDKDATSSPVFPSSFAPANVRKRIMLADTRFSAAMMACGLWCEGFAPRTAENSKVWENYIFEDGEQDAASAEFSAGPLHYEKMDKLRSFSLRKPQTIPGGAHHLQMEPMWGCVP